MKKILLIAFTLLAFAQTEAQKKWWVPTKRELLSYGSLTVSGVAYGFNQAIEHHAYGIGQPYVDITYSYKRKYKNYDEGNFDEAYFGSKTFLAFTTDAFHLSNTINKAFLTTGIVLNSWDFKSEMKQYKKKDRWKVIALKKILIPLIVQHLSFEVMFNNLHK